MEKTSNDIDKILISEKDETRQLKKNPEKEIQKNKSLTNVFTLSDNMEPLRV